MFNNLLVKNGGKPVAHNSPEAQSLSFLHSQLQNGGSFNPTLMAESIVGGIPGMQMAPQTYDTIRDLTNQLYEYSKSYIKVLNNILDTNIIFKALNSPKFYNYLTDKINVELSKKDILKLFKYIKEEELKQEVFNIIKDSSTSKDGYVAFYNYADFFKKDNLDILVECLIDVIIENLQDKIIDGICSDYMEIVLNEDIKEGF